MNKLKVIAAAMAEMGLNYALLEWNTTPAYPYFTGEYQETEPQTEDGFQETTFILNGFSRNSLLELEKAKEKIALYFSPISGHVDIMTDGSVVAVFYVSSMVIPTDDAELKRMQINLKIKEWKVM